MQSHKIYTAIIAKFPNFPDAKIMAAIWANISIAQAKAQLYRMINAPLACETSQDIELIRLIVNEKVLAALINPLPDFDEQSDAEWLAEHELHSRRDYYESCGQW